MSTATAKKVRVPGAAPAPISRDSGFTAADAPQPEKERPVTPIPAALTGVEMVRSNAADLNPDAAPATEAELQQARVMSQAMAPIAKAFERVADSMEREEVKVAPLPPKASAPMYAYTDIEDIVREGKRAGLTADESLQLHDLKTPLLTDKGWLLDVNGARFGV